jgi:hypothetical protein
VITSGIVPLLIAGGILFWFFVWTRRLLARIDDERFEYRDWLSSHDVAWTEIVSITPGMNMPYYHTRFRGPWVYVAETPTEEFGVNTLYFPREFEAAFLASLRQHRIFRRRRER